MEVNALGYCARVLASANCSRVGGSPVVLGKMVEGHQYCEAGSFFSISERKSLSTTPPSPRLQRQKQVVSATLELILTRVWRSWAVDVAAFGGTRFGPNQVAHPPNALFFIRAKKKGRFFLFAR